MEDSDDDLEITNVVRRELAKDGQEESEVSSITEDDSNAHKKYGSYSENVRYDGERVKWSDGEENTYEKFKNRKAIRRKHVAATTRKAKAVARDIKVKTKSGKLACRDGGEAKGTPVHDASSDDDLMEYTLPDYLQRRRSRFEVNRERLKEAGLRLPPDYDDIEFSDDDRLDDLQEKPKFPAAKPCAPYQDIDLPYSLGIIPAPLVQWLRQYQVKGVAFLHELFVYQKGGILGDDMGLGKTVQVVAFLTAAFGKTGDERDAKRMRKMRRAAGPRRWYPRVLVICPGSLIENWKAEFHRWGWWHVDVYHSDTKESAIEAATSGRLEIMITTYATYRLNRSAINMIEWDCVIADECHMVKEKTSEITQAMNDVNALCRIGLTGTAIQNKYEELWTLLNWTNPGRFGPMSTWKASISEPLRIGQSHDATMYQLSKARKTAKKLVQNLLPQFFLRRMKTLLRDQLPKKSDKVVFCPLTETQRDAYKRFLDGELVEYIKKSSQMCECGSGKKRGWCCYDKLPGNGRWQNYIFPAIMTLQKLSNHLGLLIPQGSEPQEKQAKDLDTLELVVPDQWRDLYRNRDSILVYSNPEFCGKWKVLKKLLRFWHGNGDKVLVFSYTVRLLKMLQLLFNHTSYNVSYLDGSMTYEDRAKAVNEFNSDPAQFIFLISTKAGGVGLNIASANKVVVVDPNWNPSYDLQAQDRAYRIGQVRDVEVFRLVSAGTIEEIVYARQIYKQQQANIGYNASTERRYFRGVQERKEQKGEIFGLKNLFSFESENVVLRDIINKTNVAESKAGVDVVGLHVDEVTDEVDIGLGRDHEDGPLSQLSALIGEEEVALQKKKAVPKKTDAIQAILAHAGVEYTHENSEVIGSSKVEARLSKRAEEAENDLDMAEETVFRKTQEGSADVVPGYAHNQPMQRKYHPPWEVMKRQFCTMAKTFGFKDATEFALVVEGWSQAQRRNCLEQFYRLRQEMMAENHGKAGNLAVEECQLISDRLVESAFEQAYWA